MQSQIQHDVAQEADLIGRFARSYRKRLSSMIEQLNAPGAPITDLQCLRMCVEAVDMILESQNHLARALSEIAAANPDDGNIRHAA